MSLNQRISPNLSERVRNQQAGVSFQAGFTLIELMVVIAIFGILMAIGGNSWSSYREATKVDSAKEKVVSVLQQSRLRAISSGFDESVVFDWPNNTITVGGQVISMSNGVDLKGYICGSATALNTGTSTFTFTSKGTTGFTYTGAGSAPAEVQVSSPSTNKVFYIKVYSVTGRVAAGTAC